MSLWPFVIILWLTCIGIFATGCLTVGSSWELAGCFAGPAVMTLIAASEHVREKLEL